MKSSKLAVAIVTPFYEPAFKMGGPVRSVSGLAQGLISHGVDVRVCTTLCGLEQSNIAPGVTQTVSGVPTTYYKIDKRGLLHWASGIPRWCDENIPKVDLVYANLNWSYPALAAMRAASRHDVPVIFAPRGSLLSAAWKTSTTKKRVYHHLLERRWLQKVGAFHYTTEAEREDSAWLNLRPPSFVLPNPIEMPPSGEAVDFRARLQVAPGVKLLSYLGRLDRAKGLFELLQAISTLKEPVHLALAGPDQEGTQAALVSRSRELGITDKVTFTGMLQGNDRFHLLRSSDLFVLPSYSENFSLAVLEAVSCGKPVVASEHVGIAGAVEKAGLCLVCKIDPIDIAAKIRAALADEALQKRAAANGLAFVRETYSKEAVARGFLEHARRLLKL
ncbi:MAG TPA: glycosyltransferase [Methylomirabilota bacterium]|nr:glycosyltransferase [Methylomirabilota bacterium]